MRAATLAGPANAISPAPNAHAAGITREQEASSLGSSNHADSTANSRQKKNETMRIDNSDASVSSLA